MSVASSCMRMVWISNYPGLMLWLAAVRVEQCSGRYLGKTNNKVARAHLYPRSPPFCDVDLSCPTTDSALELTFASSTMLMSLIVPTVCTHTMPTDATREC